MRWQARLAESPVVWADGDAGVGYGFVSDMRSRTRCKYAFHEFDDHPLLGFVVRFHWDRDFVMGFVSDMGFSEWIYCGKDTILEGDNLLMGFDE